MSKIHSSEIKMLIIANLIVWATATYLVIKKARYGCLIARNDRTRVIISAQDDDRSYVINIDNGQVRGMTDFEMEMPIAKKSILRIYQTIDENQLVHICSFEPQRNDAGVFALHISEKNGNFKVSNCKFMKTH